MNNQRFRNRRGGRLSFDHRGGRGAWRHAYPRGPQSFDPYSRYRGYPGNRSVANRNVNQNWNNVKRELPGERLSEKDIGVTEYISEHKGFHGIIKSRYSDFQVSEINLNGEVAQLTDLKPPEPPQDEKSVVEDDDDLLFSKYNLEILPMDTWDSINKLAVCTQPPYEKVEVDVTGMTKEQRTKIHDAVKKAFDNLIIGSTITVEDKKLVQFQKFRKGVRIDRRVKWIWPAEYVHFIVHKQNCDTMEAASRIAEQLRMNMSARSLGYAGTKDRRASTSQWFSARRVDPRRLAGLARANPNLALGNYSFAHAHLKLGMLQGNRFRIALRNVTASDEVVDHACEELKTKGFLNYYGLQRFGTRINTPTCNIGLKLLQNDFKGAVDYILDERNGDMQFVLRKYKEDGAAHALRQMPRPTGFRKSAIEMKVLRSLAKNPNDYVGAFSRLPRNNRLLYLHAYQSAVWNRCVSERVRRYGLTPVVGDLVPLADIQTEIIDDEIIEDTGNLDGDDQEDEEKADGISETLADDAVDGKKQTDKQEEVKNDVIKEKCQVRALTQEDVDSERYSISDVILPLPGLQVDYPTNMKDYYEELLTKDGLTLDMKHKIKSYSLSGAYRRMVVRPADTTWSRVRYSDPCADLILSDRDLLDGRQLDPEPEDGKYKALLLTMSLPASCYATMALRELLKIDTSSDYQAQQNNYHKITKNTQEVNENKEETDQKNEKEIVNYEEDVKDTEKRKMDDEPGEVEAKKLKEDCEQ